MKDAARRNDPSFLPPLRGRGTAKRWKGRSVGRLDIRGALRPVRYNCRGFPAAISIYGRAEGTARRAYALALLARERGKGKRLSLFSSRLPRDISNDPGTGSYIESAEEGSPLRRLYRIARSARDISSARHARIGSAPRRLIPFPISFSRTVPYRISGSGRPLRACPRRRESLRRLLPRDRGR